MHVKLVDQTTLDALPGNVLAVDLQILALRRSQPDLDRLGHIAVEERTRATPRAAVRLLARLAGMLLSERVVSTTTTQDGA
jgi:hypothetical protein